MKYMIMMFGDQATMMEERSVEWIKEMIEFMGTVERRPGEVRGARLRGGLGRPDPGEDRGHRERHPGRHGWTVRRGQGVAGRFLDHRRRRRGTCDRVHIPNRCLRRTARRGAAGRRRTTGVLTLDPTIEDLLRELAPQVLGTLVRRFGQFDACEDAVQEALLAASVQWAEDGVPDSPRSWLVTVASRRLVRRMAERRCAPAPGGDGRCDGAVERGVAPGARRHALAPVPVLPSLVVRAFAARPHPASGRRADHGGDRERVLRSRGHDGSAHQSREADHQELRSPIRSSARPSMPAACRSCCRCST